MGKKKIKIDDLGSTQATNETLAESVEKFAKALNIFLDVDKLRKAFTTFISFCLVITFVLLVCIVGISCFYIIQHAFNAQCEKIASLLSQIGSIIISFGGWLTASIIAIKKR